MGRDRQRDPGKLALQRPQGRYFFARARRGLYPHPDRPRRPKKAGKSAGALTPAWHPGHFWAVLRKPPPHRTNFRQWGRGEMRPFFMTPADASRRFFAPFQRVPHLRTVFVIRLFFVRCEFDPLTLFWLTLAGLTLIGLTFIA